MGKLTEHQKNEIKNYIRIKEELCCTVDGLILRGTRILIPNKLQNRVIDIAHEGHLGIVKTKQLLREKVWFTGLDKLVEDKIRNCIQCQACTPDHSKPEVHMSELPESPWMKLSMDFKGPLHDGSYAVVLLDDYSRYPIVDFTMSLKAKDVIPILDKMLSEFGTPEEIRTDNGAPFNSQDFQNFMIEMGINHRKITPLHPQANGEVEKFMSSIAKVIKTSKIEDSCYKQAIYKFLRNYRSCPYPSTRKSPYDCIFKNEIKTKLPTLKSTSTEDAIIRKNDEKAKKKMKHYHSKSNRIRNK